MDQPNVSGNKVFGARSGMSKGIVVRGYANPVVSGNTVHGATETAIEVIGAGPVKPETVSFWRKWVPTLARLAIQYRKLISSWIHWN